MSDSIDHLYSAIVAVQDDGPGASRTVRLLRSSRTKISKKVAEEAVEVALDAVADDKDGVVRESADLLYNLVVLWVSLGIKPKDVWSEMERRERLLGLAEKLPKNKVPDGSSRRKVVTLDARRVRKGR